MATSLISRARLFVDGCWLLVPPRRTTINQQLPTLGVLLLLLASCTKEPIYELNDVGILPPSANKDQPKTNEQYVAILHANLFQDGMSSNEIYGIGQCIESIGDKELAREVIISNFMNKPGVILPSDSAMRADINAFTVETYRRFLVRDPSEAEKTWFRNYIEADPNVTPEIVYFSFAMSDEYTFY